jgi:hypothetical protein
MIGMLLYIYKYLCNINGSQNTDKQKWFIRLVAALAARISILTMLWLAKKGNGFRWSLQIKGRINV